MQRKVFRVKGIVLRADLKSVFACFNDVYLEHTPHVRVNQRFQDKRSNKLMAAGKKKRNRKGYGKTVFVEFKSDIQSDMITLHEMVSPYILPGTDSSKL